MEKRLENKKITVVIADDHAILRQGLESLIKQQEDIDVVGDASIKSAILSRKSSIIEELDSRFKSLLPQLTNLGSTALSPCIGSGLFGGLLYFTSTSSSSDQTLSS